MLKDVTQRINARIQAEEDILTFRDLISEDATNIDNILDAPIKNYNESGDDNMLRDDFDFLFEDTQTDAELQTFLQDETFPADNASWGYRSDMADSDLTKLQSSTDYNDNYSFNYTSDSLPNTNLNKETNYSDNQHTPVDITGFSNESVEMDALFLLEEAEQDSGEGEPTDTADEDFFFEDDDMSDIDNECGDDDMKSEDFFFEDDDFFN